jgi:hypothetical protein
MKKTEIIQKTERVRDESTVDDKTSKQALAPPGGERWMSAPKESTKSQTYELGRNKRTW